MPQGRRNYPGLLASITGLVCKSRVLSDLEDGPGTYLTWKLTRENVEHSIIEDNLLERLVEGGKCDAT